MKRQITASLIAIVLLGIGFLLLPSTQAKRGEERSGQSGGRKPITRNAKSTSLPNFLLPQTPAGPVSVQASKFAESLPLRDIPSSGKGNMTDYRNQGRGQ